MAPAVARTSLETVPSDRVSISPEGWQSESYLYLAEDLLEPLVL